MKSNKMRDLAKVRRRKITIRKKTVGFDEWENQVESWVEWKILWAERTALWGQEYVAAQAINQEQTIEFTVRHVGFLDELNTVDFDVLYNGKEYDIKHIDPFKDDGMWIKLRCLERGLSD